VLSLTWISIVAVHGLNPRSRDDTEHAWNTWRNRASGRLWLRDDLPQSTPEARIFIYEYNATAVYGKDKSTFVDKSNELLEALRAERDDEERPILFLAHSMGGLLVKQALINAGMNPKYRMIKDMTKGIAFFATPHHGGDMTLVGLGSIATRIARSAGLQQGDDVLETLKSGSIFSDVIHEHWRHQMVEYNIISFWGALDTVSSSRIHLRSVVHY
jgi:triacylglycerol esterase/lipase EstA (alpha/beta hydrolase family)